MTADDVRQFALSLPDATEEPHFHFASFRISGRIFATMPPSNRLLHVFVPETEREVAITVYPDICESLQWGKSTVGVRIDLEQAEDDLVRGLIRAAYEHKAPAKS